MKANNTYEPLSLREMMQNSDIDVRIKERINYLVNLGAVTIQAAKNDTTFVAYAGVHMLTNKAVLCIDVNIHGGCVYAYEAQHLTKYPDLLLRVVMTLAKHGAALREL